MGAPMSPEALSRRAGAHATRDLCEGSFAVLKVAGFFCLAPFRMPGFM